MLVAGAVAMFGAGFGAGHYRSADPKAPIDTTNTARQDERLSLAAITTLNKAGFLVSQTPPANGGAFHPIQVQQPRKNEAALSSPVLPPHQRVFSVEEQTQWEIQQREAREAGLAQLDAMIQSMESAGLSEEQIKSFRELKETQAKAPFDELPVWDLSPPESTPEELRADFAASLEQANVPEAHRKAMLEAFSQQFAPTGGNRPDAFSVALPSHEPPN